MWLQSGYQGECGYHVGTRGNVGTMWVPSETRIEYHVGTKWVPSGYLEVSKWVPSGHLVGTK